MNDAFKSQNPRPHVHFHMRPRFNEKTAVFGAAFEDTTFGHHYAVGGNTTLPVQSAQKLYEHLKEKLPFYMELCKNLEAFPSGEKASKDGKVGDVDGSRPFSKNL